MEEEGQSAPPAPKTDVSFAPTTAFAKAFPAELAEQNKKFNTPTWQTRTQEPPETPPAPAPSPKRARVVQCNPDPVFDYLHDDNVPALVFGAFFFAALAYLVARGVQWHLN